MYSILQLRLHPSLVALKKEVEATSSNKKAAMLHMPGLSRQVKALRTRLKKNTALQEKAACIQDQITTIT